MQPHKPGRRAGKSARDKHQQAKNSKRQCLKQTLCTTVTKLDRQNAAKQQRDQKRETLLAKRRQVGAPRVVTLLPMSQDINVEEFWNQLMTGCTCEAQPIISAADEAMEDAEPSTSYSQVPTLTSLPGEHKHHVYWIPAPRSRSDPLALVDLARHAEVVLLVHGETGEIDQCGELAMAILRNFGLPTLVPVVLPPPGAGLKVRAASKKLAAAALAQQGITDYKVLAAGNASDLQQLLRHIGETSIKLPSWRQQRPSLLAEAASFVPTSGDAATGTLILKGFVRVLGLSANQAIHLPGAGDFQIDRIEGPPRPEPSLGQKTRPRQGGSMDVDGGTVPVLGTADVMEREELTRENQPNPLDAEQTWPTEEELADAAMEVEAKKRILPKGTSEYQAAWILDNDFSDEEVEEVDLAPRQPHSAQEAASEPPDWEDAMDDAETSFGLGDDDIDSASARKPSRREQAEDFQFPDEIDTPEGLPAKQRFAKYRGLKSWRSSPWDPKESLPAEYARIFAFQNIKRAQKRAKQFALRVGGVGDLHGVPAETYIDVHVAQVPAEAAAAIASRVASANKGEVAPFVAFGLLQHETRLSVLNFAVRKAASFEEPIANKAPLLFVAGYRTYTARPIFSTDEHGATKFKMERFLQPGQNAIATVHAPIAYPPVPLLAFHRNETTGQLSLAASGSLRSCNPDRVVLKRIVLSGYPVRVHKKKAVVRWMFHSPDDVRWFRPLELWTKHGLRGRIKEPVGTHGSMKCIFDGVANQQDAVCASLYKRVFPKWPESMSFAG